MEINDKWFANIDFRLLTEFIKNNIYSVFAIEYIQDEDIIKVEYHNRFSDRDEETYFSPFGMLEVRKVGNVYRLQISSQKNREFFDMMYNANKGKIINGKTYPEAWKEAQRKSCEDKINSERDVLTIRIEELEKQRDELDSKLDSQITDLDGFINPIIERDKNEKSLILKDILNGMTASEREKLLQELGYIPANQIQSKHKTEIINNGLNDIVLDFDTSK